MGNKGDTGLALWVALEQIKALESRVAEIEGALSFYGNENNYMVKKDEMESWIEIDWGKQAREALTEKDKP